jgi:hypothetical protein
MKEGIADFFQIPFILPTGNYIIYEEFVKESLPIGKFLFPSFFRGVDTA